MTEDQAKQLGLGTRVRGRLGNKELTGTITELVRERQAGVMVNTAVTVTWDLNVWGTTHMRTDACSALWHAWRRLPGTGQTVCCNCSGLILSPGHARHHDCGRLSRAIDAYYLSLRV